MRLRTGTIILLVLCAFAAIGGAPAYPAPATPAAPLRDTGAPPYPAGDRPVRMAAARVTRIPQETGTLLLLDGNAGVFQGGAAFTAARLAVWITEEGAPGRRAATVRAYGETDIRVVVPRETRTHAGPTLMQFTAAQGLSVQGSAVTVAEDAPPDDFLARAVAFREGKAGEDAQAVMTRIKVSAESVLYEDAREADLTAVLLYGNARIIYGNMTLQADAMRLTLRRTTEGEAAARPESVYAEGLVELVRGDERILAQSVYVDVPAEEGVAVDARVRLLYKDRKEEVPIQVHGENVRMLDRYHFRIEGPGYITTSASVPPHYRIEGRDITASRPIRAETEEPSEEGALRGPLTVTSRHNLLYLGPAPVFYWPYLSKDVGEGFLLRRLKLGHSSRFGYTAEAVWDLYQTGLYRNDWSELSLRTDAYSERGLGAGLDFTFKRPERKGMAHGYYINDSAERDDRGMPVPGNRRGDLTVRHREFLPEDFRLDLELGYLSDRQFLRFYDRKEYDEEKDRETAVYLSRARGNTLLDAEIKHRINDFQNTVERQAAGFHVIGQPFFDSPLVWTSHADVARMTLRTDEALGLPRAENVTRFNANWELSLPFGGEAARVDPYSWSDYSFYKMRAGRCHRTARLAHAYGARAASNFYRTYDAESPLLDVNRVRHIATPTAEYRSLWMLSRRPGRLVQHDEIDALNRLHRTSLGLHNRFQTHRMADGARETVDFLLFDADYLFHHRDTGADRDADDYLTVNVRWKVTDHVEIASEDNRYNTERGRLEALNGEVSVDWFRPFRVSAHHNYFEDLVNADGSAQSVSSLQVVYQPDFSRWRTELSTSYNFQARRRPGDLRDPRELGTKVSFTRQLEGWEVTLEADFNQGRMNETRYSINIRPPGQ